MKIINSIIHIIAVIIAWRSKKPGCIPREINSIIRTVHENEIFLTSRVACSHTSAQKCEKSDKNNARRQSMQQLFFFTSIAGHFMNIYDFFLVCKIFISYLLVCYTFCMFLCEKILFLFYCNIFCDDCSSFQLYVCSLQSVLSLNL